MDIYTIDRSKNYIAFQELDSDQEGSIRHSRFHVDKSKRIVVFRDFAAAGAYWDANPELIEHTGLVELASRDLEELAATGKYAGLALHMVEGVQALPLPEIHNRPRAAAKREDFD